MLSPTFKIFPFILQGFHSFHVGLLRLSSRFSPGSAAFFSYSMFIVSICQMIAVKPTNYCIRRALPTNLALLHP